MYLKERDKKGRTMRYFLDTEFIEKPCTIQLISIGLVAEDGRELYQEYIFNADDACEWVRENVIKHLQWPPVDRLTAAMGRKQILDFIGEDKPEFWGYYADYDWVAFCWVFGRMIDLPRHFPMYCRDLKQWLDEIGNPRIPFKPDEEHNALSDARWNRLVYNWLKAQPLSGTYSSPGSTFIADKTE